MTTAIDLRDVFCVFPSARGGVAALQGLTLAVPTGETCVVLGPSGSGKTTLLRVLAGLQRPLAGSVCVVDHDLTALTPRSLAAYRSRHLGYADQHYWLALAGELTAAELIEVPLGLTGLDSTSRRSRSLELLERVGLEGMEGARPGELSGGEQQRIALAAALAGEPDVLVADEPTGELDVKAADDVYALLADLVREHGTTAVVVSHDPASARIADRVVHIRDGRVSEEGAGEDGVAVVGVVVQARGLSRAYARESVLEAFSARFEPFTLSVVTGPSGSGKSTLLALLAGLDVPDAGEVVVGDLHLSRLDRADRARARRGLVGYVGQSPALAGFLTARESVELALAVHGLERAAAQARAGESLGLVGLAEHAERELDVLSAGQQERVALARALASQPAMLLVDEPTSRLDLATTAEIGRLLASLAHDLGTTVVCATHDPVLVAHADAEVPLEKRSPVRSAP